MGWADAPPPPYSAVAPDQPPPSYTPNMSAPAPMRRESSISEPAGRAISLQERRGSIAFVRTHALCGHSPDCTCVWLCRVSSAIRASAGYPGGDAGVARGVPSSHLDH